MQQYKALKAEYPDTLLLFRVGDFYETFDEDAVAASKALHIVLTKRSNGAAGDTPLAGFPYHSLETYLPKLVLAGMRVAVCEQLEDPKQVKGIVKRGVTEVVTPGIAHYEPLLKAGSNNFLASVHCIGQEVGVAMVDVTTGAFFATQGSLASMDRWLQGFAPSEVLCNRRDSSAWVDSIRGRYTVFGLEEWIFQTDAAHATVKDQFGVASVKGFGLDQSPLAVTAAGVILHYLKQSHYTHTKHITGISKWQENGYLWMDRFTVRNLELFNPSGERGMTLVDVLDATNGPMGSRLLRRWIAFPLTDQNRLEDRLDRVDFAVQQREKAAEWQEYIALIHDLERLSTRLSTRRMGPRECLRLGESLKATMALHSSLADTPALSAKVAHWPLVSDDYERIEAMLSPEAPVQLTKGNVVASGVHSELDQLRDLKTNAQAHLNDLVQREQASTGITSLRIVNNGVFGYAFEVRNSHADKVPADWIRKQTLVNAERYITPELKTLENRLQSADDRIVLLESELYYGMLDELLPSLPKFLSLGALVAEWDVLLGFASLAVRHAFVRPNFTTHLEWEVRQGRHPVIERALPLGQSYIPNDVILSEQGERIWMITGPNMSGKSALLRQTALHAVMAQMGCFVPAESALLPLLDRLFVRVGASDNLSQGESTFMVEMSETASILHNLTPRSLVLLDEIGRGTSTYDGISLAQSIAEYLHNHPVKPLVLFATHYHELNDLASEFPAIANRHVAVQEIEWKVVFLRTLMEGGSEHSFGLHVAQLAGIPPWVVLRAADILKNLEAQRDNALAGASSATGPEGPNVQLSFIQWEDPGEDSIKKELRSLDINTLTPMDALLFIHRWQKK